MFRFEIEQEGDKLYRSVEAQMIIHGTVKPDVAVYIH